MDAKEFVRLSVSLGYCGRKAAKKYVSESGKQVFCEDDFIRVYRIAAGAEEAVKAFDEKIVIQNGRRSRKILD